MTTVTITSGSSWTALASLLTSVSGWGAGGQPGLNSTNGGMGGCWTQITNETVVLNSSVPYTLGNGTNTIVNTNWNSGALIAASSSHALAATTPSAGAFGGGLPGNNTGGAGSGGGSAGPNGGGVAGSAFSGSGGAGGAGDAGSGGAGGAGGGGAGVSNILGGGGGGGITPNTGVGGAGGVPGGGGGSSASALVNQGLGGVGQIQIVYTPPPPAQPFVDPWFSTVSTAWVPVDPNPTLPVKLAQGFISYQPFSPLWLQSVLSAWAPVDPPQIITAKFPQLPPPVPPGPFANTNNFYYYPRFDEEPMMHPVGLAPDEWWPELVPSTEYADFSYDATGDLSSGDSIVSLSLSISPSGLGEAVASRLSLSVAPSGVTALVTAWITGGVPGRVYLYQLVITTAMARQIPILIGQKCVNVLSQYPLPAPTNPGFGTPITWMIV